MAALENNKRIRVSVIDILIIIAVIACIAGVVVHYKVYEKVNEVKTDDLCSVSVLIRGASLEMSESVTVGDQIFFGESGDLLGKVAEINKSDATVYYRNYRDEIVEYIDNSLFDVVIVLDVSGSLTDSGFLVNGTEYVAAGEEFVIYSKLFSGKCLVIDVENKQE